MSKSSESIRGTKRLALYLRDHGKCVYCGCQVVRGAGASNPRGMAVDHWRPQRGGVDNRLSNLLTSCHQCNGSKGGKTARGWWAAVREAHGAEHQQRVMRRVHRALAKDTRRQWRTARALIKAADAAALAMAQG